MITWLLGWLPRRHRPYLFFWRYRYVDPQTPQAIIDALNTAGAKRAAEDAAEERAVDKRAAAVDAANAADQAEAERDKASAELDAARVQLITLANMYYKPKGTITPPAA